MTPRLFDLHYALVGDNLDVDSLLTVAQPARRYSVWRRGDIRARGPAKTSGLHVDVAEQVTREALVVEAFNFLSNERTFLETATGHLTEGAWHELEVIVGVFGWGETSFHWPPDLLRALAEVRLGLGVEAWPLQSDQPVLESRHGSNDRPTTG